MYEKEAVRRFPVIHVLSEFSGTLETSLQIDVIYFATRKETIFFEKSQADMDIILR